jgi:2-dehydropantoate 2-reductase
MRFVVYGAGAIGGVLGARLHESGRDVTLVARGSHYEAIRDHGLSLVEVDGEVKRLRVPVVERIADAPLNEGDVVFLTMKTQDTEDAVRELAASAPPRVAVACAQNGVESERIALRRFGDVYAVVVLSAAAHLEPGVVEVRTAPISGILDIGRFPHGADSTARAIADSFRDAGYLSEVRHDIMPWKYAKLLGNANNALIVLAGAEAPKTELGKSVRAEAEGILRTAGIPVVDRAEYEARSDSLLRQLAGSAGNSTWQSVVRGSGSIETDYLNGEIVLVARRNGVDAPLNELIQRLARELVLTGGELESVPIEQIARLLAVDDISASA